MLGEIIKILKALVSRLLYGRFQYICISHINLHSKHASQNSQRTQSAQAVPVARCSKILKAVHNISILSLPTVHLRTATKWRMEDDICQLGSGLSQDTAVNTLKRQRQLQVASSASGCIQSARCDHKPSKASRTTVMHTVISLIRHLNGSLPLCLLCFHEYH